jgi:hypothetical protein
MSYSVAALGQLGQVTRSCYVPVLANNGLQASLTTHAGAGICGKGLLEGWSGTGRSHG